MNYVDRLQKLSYELLSLVAEALGLAPNAFNHFFEAGGNEDRAKIVKYPAPTDDSSDQGVGPHFDGGFLTLVGYQYHVDGTLHRLRHYSQLLQASSHRGLQVQNLSGAWIDAPPVPYTFVVNIGKSRFVLYKCGLG